MNLQGNLLLDQFIQKVKLGTEPFERKVPILVESSRYLLKTVENFSELQSALRLRHDVFFALGLGKKLPFELDFDQFDLDSDHLVVVEKQTGQVVGNYRMRCSLFHPQFYSEGEFFMNELLSGTKQDKVEIGRACIHPDHRNGSVIQLLWRGLLRYMRGADARYLFGCSSISTQIPGQIEYVWNYLNEHKLMNEKFQVQPRRPFEFRNGGTEGVGQMELPALLFSYIRSGAKVLGPPAFDPEFECADFLTLLDLNDLTQKRSRRYESSLQPVTV